MVAHSGTLEAVVTTFAVIVALGAVVVSCGDKAREKPAERAVTVPSAAPTNGRPTTPPASRKGTTHEADDRPFDKAW